MSTADYEPPPPTLGALWLESGVVARVRVIGSSLRRQDVSASRSRALTAHDVQIVEVFRNDQNAVANGGHVTVLQHGGSVADRGGAVAISAVDNFPVLKVGQELVLFLKPWPAAGGYAVAYGPAGALAIEGDEIVVPPEIATYTEFGGRKRVPAATFIALLRQLPSAKH